MRIIIGARGSKLSLKQADIIKDYLLNFKCDLVIEVKIIKTQGDKDMSPVPLDSVGKGWFTKELDKALLGGSIDLAVHSLKDIPETLPDGLIIAAIPHREDAREAYVSKGNVPFVKLKKGAVIGTDSLRRKSQILQMRSDLMIKSLRGNVNTRLEKLEKGEFDGIFLAVAGLKRLGLENRITEYISEIDMVPSPGQGALAVVIKKNNTHLFRLLQKIVHKPTIRAVKAERAFSKAFGGGCKIPVGAYARCIKNKLVLYGYVGSIDGMQYVQESLSGSVTSPQKLGNDLASRLLKKSKPWFTAEIIKYVVVTRPENDNKELKKKLENLGLGVLSYPTIAITSSKIIKQDTHHLMELSTFDWILFTSRYGVHYFMQAISRLKFDSFKFKKIQIGVVGPKTAAEARKFGLKVSSIPDEFTTEKLGTLFEDLKGKKILLPRAAIASDVLPKILKKKGAYVTEIPIYKTTFISSPNAEFERLLESNQISCITFTSPSTVTGFIRGIKGNLRSKELFSLPVIVIGPVTSKTAKKEGFKNVFIADTFTSDGLVTKVKEIVL